MTATQLLRRAPEPVRRWALHFECAIEDAVGRFAGELPESARVLDAGAGDGAYRQFFARHRYWAIDLDGEREQLDAVADVTALPFRPESFDGVLSVVTLEHVTDPAAALREVARVLKPGGQLLLVTPLDWEEHQQPHDYFRYTRFGLRLLVERAGLEATAIVPAGGYFRLLSRRLLSGLQFFMKGTGWVLFVPAALVLIPLSLLVPLFEPLDREQNFTLGYLCTARKPF